MSIIDVDGDGDDEIMFLNNGGTGYNRFDNWYVLSVNGLGPSATWKQEARWSSRASDNFDPVISRRRERLFNSASRPGWRRHVRINP